VQRCAFGQLIELAVTAEERPVDATSVDHEPMDALVLERAVRLTGDEQLRIGLERDVVQLRQSTHADAIARKLESPGIGGVRSRDDHACGSAGFHWSPISCPWIDAIVARRLRGRQEVGT